MQRWSYLTTVLACLCFCVPVVAQSYTLTPLGYLPGGNPQFSWAYGISENGSVTGDSTSTDAGLLSEAFVWMNNTMVPNGNLQPLPFHSTGWDVNNANRTCGQSLTQQGWQAFEWSQTNGMQGLGYLGACTNFDSEALGMSNTGYIAGQTSTNLLCFEGTLWFNSAFVQLIGTLSGDIASSATDVNDNIPPEVSAISYDPNALRRPLLWDQTNGAQPLALLGGDTTGEANAINDLVDIAGRSDLEAVIWLASNGHSPTALPFLSGGNSAIAWDINNHQQVVGTSHSSNGQRGFIWDACNGTRELQSLVDSSGAGWQLTQAFAINDGGQIVGYGNNPSGTLEAYLLTPITGACCLPSGACEILTQADCQCLGGTYVGNNTLCSPDPCSGQLGACCLALPPLCLQMSGIDCLLAGGTYLGDGIACSPDPCLTAPGACCLPILGTVLFECVQLGFNDCNVSGGQFQGIGVACDPFPCPGTPTGACCMLDPAEGFICFVTTESDCLAGGGIYLGDAVPCTPDPCNPAPGACCLPDGTGSYFCQQELEVDCIALGGLFIGSNTPCIPSPCDKIGACCVPVPGTPDTTCIISTEPTCFALDGDYQGDGIVCVPDPCPEIGACCIKDPTGGEFCVLTSPQVCNAQDGNYQGAGSSCSPNPCPCLGDVTGDLFVDIADVLFVLDNWGVCPNPCPPCDGDANCDCVVDILDLLIVLQNWGPCP